MATKSLADRVAELWVDKLIDKWLDLLADRVANKIVEHLMKAGNLTTFEFDKELDQIAVKCAKSLTKVFEEANSTIERNLGTKN